MEALAFVLVLICLGIAMAKLFLLPTAPGKVHREVTFEAGALIAMARAEVANARVKALEDAEAAIRHREVVAKETAARQAVISTQLALDRKVVERQAKAATDLLKYLKNTVDAELKVAAQEHLDLLNSQMSEQLAEDARLLTRIAELEAAAEEADQLEAEATHSSSEVGPQGDDDMPPEAFVNDEADKG